MNLDDPGSSAGRTVVLYGVGSPLAVDVQESCRRAGMTIAACIRNVDGDTFLIFGNTPISPQDIDPQLLSHPVVLPMFGPRNRAFAWEEARRFGFTRAGTLVDPSAVLAGSAVVGAGVYLNAGVVIGGCVTLEDFALVNRAASIGHHSHLGAYSSVGPGVSIAGSVRIGRNAVLGAGAVIGPGMNIGDDAVVGTGSVVLKDVPPRSVVLGNPARIVRTIADG